MKAFGISKTSADTYKRIYKLVSKAPRLINCQMSVNRFLKHYDIMIEYFDSDVQSPWKHALTCSCEGCLSFQLLKFEGNQPLRNVPNSEL